MSIVMILWRIVRPRRVRLVLMTAASYLFYWFAARPYAALMLLSTTVDFTVGILLEHADTLPLDEAARTLRRKLVLVLPLVFNVGLLSFFKYFTFFVDSVNTICGSSPPLIWQAMNVVLPAGISFYTFQSMGYSIDVYRRDLRARRSFLEFAAFVSLFSAAHRRSNRAPGGAPSPARRPRAGGRLKARGGALLVRVRPLKKVLVAKMENPTFDKRKLAVFVALVVAACGAIARMNQYVSSKEAVDDPESRQKLDAALASLTAKPKELAIQLVPGPAGERLLRHQHERHLAAVDVIVLGQSDADHMSAEFFRDDVHFYNGFISNSYFAYQYEVYEALSMRGITPTLVLWDVRSGFILQGDGTGCEPSLDEPDTAPGWYAGPPFRGGVARTTAPWWTQFDSLLSLRQTEHSFEVLTAKKADHKPGGPRMDVAPFELVPRAGASAAYRWLADGSRVYPGEDDGKLPPREPTVRVTEATGQRKLRPLQVARFGEYVSRVVAAGSRVIAYSPPVHPASYADPTQLGPIRAVSTELESVLRGRNVDFVDFTLEAENIGCAEQDFKDEQHISRACNEKIVRALSTRAALASHTLRGLVTRKLLAK